ncbi:MAG: hypothetical protein OXG06_05315 [Gammaproteobacteria bacterium]|nr:hypothetical protein [Gammaproteobacteria bacterium]
MSPDSKHPRTRKMIRREIHMLLAIAGFTVCMALFNGIYPGANPEPELPERVAPQPGP